MRLIVNGILLISLVLGGFTAKLAYDVAYDPAPEPAQVEDAPNEEDPQSDEPTDSKDTVVRYKRCKPPAVKRGKKCVVFVKPKKKKRR